MYIFTCILIFLLQIDSALVQLAKVQGLPFVQDLYKEHVQDILQRVKYTISIHTTVLAENKRNKIAQSMLNVHVMLIYSHGSINLLKGQF